ncbi:MAG: hypothetical protein WC455_15920 [Dehalococcoidia bacterium]|jgi:hypothetical protein
MMVAKLRIQAYQDRRDICAILATAGYYVVVVKSEFPAWEGGDVYDVVISEPEATP